LLPIGVLALQGDFREHIETLRVIGVQAIEIRKPDDLSKIAGLIIPGGESTVIDKLSKIFSVREPLIKLIQSGFPVFGTCAGLIMLANKIIDGTPTQESFGGLDIEVRRNAFGSQVDSFEADVEFADSGYVHVAFIRAPIVTALGSEVETLAKFGSDIVAVRQDNLLGISFHPEVTGVTAVHEYFIQMCRDANFQHHK